MASNLGFYNIKIPASNVTNEKGMESFLQTVHRALPSNTHLSLEFLSESHFLNFYIVIDKQHKSLIESQLYAYYQDIEISEDKDWLSRLKGHKEFVELKFKHTSFSPIRTYHHLEENLISNILAYVGKMEPEESFFMQLVLKRAGKHSWDRGFHGLMYELSGNKPGKDGKPTAAQYKYSRNIYRGRLRLGIVSKDQASARTKLLTVANFYKQLKTASNKLKVNKYTLFDKGPRLEKAIKNRTLLHSDYWMPAEVATVYHFPYQQGSVANVVQTTSRKAPAPDVLPKKTNSSEKETTFFGTTNYRNSNVPFGIKRDDRRRHLYVVGKTGSGKSKLLEMFIEADLKNGEGCCVIDPHGDLADEMLRHVPKNRIKDVVYVNPADREFPIAFNPLEYTDDYERRQRIARFFIAIFKKIFSNDWNERVEHVLRYIILALLETRDSNVLGITRILSDSSYRKRVVKEVTDPVVQQFWANEFAGYNEQYSAQAIVPLTNKVGQFVANPVIRNMIGQQRSALDFEDFMNNGKIVLLNLSKGKMGDDNSALLGSMFITKIQQAALARANIPEEDRRDFYFYIDEFQNFATEAFESILSEARKYRLNLTVAHQYIEQLPEDVRSTVFGNVASLISFAVGGRDAEYLSKEFAPVFEPNDMINLEAREMYLKLLVDGRIVKPFSGRTLDAPKAKSDHSQDIIDHVRKTYAKNRLTVEREIQEWSDSKSTKIMSDSGGDFPEPIL